MLILFAFLHSFIFQAMTCLVHNARYRSLFHSVVNELRRENRTSALILRNMPRQCCTCQDVEKLTSTSVDIPDKETLKNLKNLTDQIDRDKQKDSKLVLALNRLENFIKENRGPEPTPVPTVVENRRSPMSSDDDDDDDDSSYEMEVDEETVSKPKKPAKPLKTGIFLYLPYQFEQPFESPVSLQVAQTLQRGRFLGRHKYIQTVEEERDIQINLITPNTSEQIKRTLENAKADIGNVKIHNKEEVSSEQDGEWILVRQKKDAEPVDLTVVLEELKNRWNGFFKIQKRKHESDETENS